MCFSAEASFTASALLFCLGAASLKKGGHTSLRWLAAIPILFAIQQFSEGILWLYLPSPPDSSPVSLAAAYLFMGFAYLFWPVWIPFALMMGEKQPLRKTLILFSLVGGVCLSSYFIFHAEGGETEITIYGNSIQYAYNGEPWRNYYAAITLIPCFLSSIRGIKVFAVLITASFFLTEYYYLQVFVSVWCFFAALISLLIYWIIKRNLSSNI